VNEGWKVLIMLRSDLYRTMLQQYWKGGWGKYGV